MGGLCVDTSHSLVIIPISHIYMEVTVEATSAFTANLTHFHCATPLSRKPQIMNIINNMTLDCS